MSTGLRQRIAQRLVTLRRHAGLSQVTVAAHLGITQQAYSNYERGRRPVPSPTLLKLLTLFGRDAAELTTLVTPAATDEDEPALACLEDRPW